MIVAGLTQGDLFLGGATVFGGIATAVISAYLSTRSTRNRVKVNEQNIAQLYRECKEERALYQKGLLEVLDLMDDMFDGPINQLPSKVKSLKDRVRAIRAKIVISERR